MKISKETFTSAEQKLSLNETIAEEKISLRRKECRR
jgi:hypothetical protein